MKSKAPRRKKRDALDISIDGAGVSPASVPLRSLAELLQAAAAAVEAVAKAEGVATPDLHLVQVKDGSAAYELVSDSANASHVISAFYDVAKVRGKGAPPQVRRALKRLHGEAAKLGALKIRARPLRESRARREIIIAAPLEGIEAGVESYAEIHGRLVGLCVSSRDQRISLSIRLEEGHTEEFSADDSLLSVARTLFNEHVRARVVYEDDGLTLEPLVVDTLDGWDRSNGDFVEAAEKLRRELSQEGIEIDSSAWLRELHTDD